jgi:uncharacterized protein (TIGR00251 family)
MPSFLRVHGDGVYLSVKLQPRASKSAIGETAGNELKVKVKAPPVDFAANEALLRLLAETLECPRGAIQIVRGNTSRHKQIFLRGLSAADVAEKLLRAAAK